MQPLPWCYPFVCSVPWHRRKAVERHVSNLVASELVAGSAPSGQLVNDLEIGVRRFAISEAQRSPTPPRRNTTDLFSSGPQAAIQSAAEKKKASYRTRRQTLGVLHKVGTTASASLSRLRTELFDAARQHVAKQQQQEERQVRSRRASASVNGSTAFADKRVNKVTSEASSTSISDDARETVVAHDIADQHMDGHSSSVVEDRSGHVMTQHHRDEDPPSTHRPVRHAGHDQHLAGRVAAARKAVDIAAVDLERAELVARHKRLELQHACKGTEDAIQAVPRRPAGEARAAIRAAKLIQDKALLARTKAETTVEQCKLAMLHAQERQELVDGVASNEAVGRSQGWQPHRTDSGFQRRLPQPPPPTPPVRPSFRSQLEERRHDEMQQFYAQAADRADRELEEAEAAFQQAEADSAETVATQNAAPPLPSSPRPPRLASAAQSVYVEGALRQAALERALEMKHAAEARERAKAEYIVAARQNLAAGQAAPDAGTALAVTDARRASTSSAPRLGLSQAARAKAYTAVAPPIPPPSMTAAAGEHKLSQWWPPAQPKDHLASDARPPSDAARRRSSAAPPPPQPPAVVSSRPDTAGSVSGDTVHTRRRSAVGHGLNEGQVARVNRWFSGDGARSSLDQGHGVGEMMAFETRCRPTLAQAGHGDDTGSSRRNSRDEHQRQSQYQQQYQYFDGGINHDHVDHYQQEEARFSHQHQFGDGDADSVGMASHNRGYMAQHADIDNHGARQQDQHVHGDQQHRQHYQPHHPSQHQLYQDHLAMAADAHSEGHHHDTQDYHVHQQQGSMSHTQTADPHGTAWRQQLQEQSWPSQAARSASSASASARSTRRSAAGTADAGAQMDGDASFAPVPRAGFLERTITVGGGGVMPSNKGAATDARLATAKGAPTVTVKRNQWLAGPKAQTVKVPPSTGIPAATEGTVYAHIRRHAGSTGTGSGDARFKRFGVIGRDPTPPPPPQPRVRVKGAVNKAGYKERDKAIKPAKPYPVAKPLDWHFESEKTAKARTIHVKAYFNSLSQPKRIPKPDWARDPHGDDVQYW